MKNKVFKNVGFFLIGLLCASCSFSTFSNGNGKKSGTIDFTNSIIKTSGNKFFDGNGNEYKIRGMNFCNNAYIYMDFEKAAGKDHDESSYKELSQLGFNSIRYYLNYRMFSYNDGTPEYTLAAKNNETPEYILTKYIDKEIENARKYGMKIVFNMHAPHGGYQSGGGGHGLWIGANAEKNQNELVDLWKTIAAHYADEPAVLGYGIVNEPYLIGDTYDIAIGRWSLLANKIISAIREVDTNHIIFVERTFKMIKVPDENNYKPAEDHKTDIAFAENPALGYPEINDSNYAYEIHFYNPGEFTNQGRGGITAEMSWPDPVPYKIEKESSLNDKVLKKQIPSLELNEWQAIQTDFYEQNDKNIQFSNWKLICSNLGSSEQPGVMYVDKIELIQKDSSGSETVVYTEEFDNSKNGFEPFNCSLSNESFDEKSVLKISGSVNYAQITNESNRLYLQTGCSYSLRFTVCLESIYGTGTNIRAEFTPCSSKSSYYDKDFLRRSIKPYSDLSVVKSVPFYVGEFGLNRNCFFVNGTNISAQKGGGQYVKDIISVFKEYDLAFSYHCYHEGAENKDSNDVVQSIEGFGYYCDAWSGLPSAKPESRIAELYEAFKSSVK